MKGVFANWQKTRPPCTHQFPTFQTGPRDKNLTGSIAKIRDNFLKNASSPIKTSV